MQAAAISNPEIPNVSGPPAVTLLPFDPQAASPFTALFQDALKSTANSGAVPAPGKPQDSNRRPANSTGTANQSPVFFFPGIPISIPILAPNPIEPALPAATLRVPAAAAAPNGDATNRGATAAAKESSSPSAFSVFASTVGQPMAIPLSGPPAPNAGSSPATDVLSPNTLGTGACSPNHPEPGASPQDPNGAARPALNLDLRRPESFSASVSPGPAPLTSAVPMAQPARADASESNGPGNPIGGNTPAGFAQATPKLEFTVPTFVPREFVLPPNQEHAGNEISGGHPEPTLNPAAEQASAQRVATNVTNQLLNILAHGTRPDPASPTAQNLMSPVATPKALWSGSTQPEINHAAQSNLQPPANPSPSLAETLQQSTAKSAAVGAPTLKFHESLKPEPSTPALAAPAVAAAPKAQPQESAGGSAGGDSNAKPDHASNAANPRAEEKDFAHSLDSAASTPPLEHSPVADPAAVAAATPLPAQPANPGAQPASASAGHAAPAESLPAAAQGAPVVSAAHMFTQPGQTEIRIEMQADSLGGIELRAHIAGDQIGASISVEHHDAQVALATDLPALHNALAEKNLRLESLTVSQGSFSSLSGGPGQDAGQRGFPQPSARFAAPEQIEPPQAYAETMPESAAPAYSGAGLSVVA